MPILQSLRRDAMLYRELLTCSCPSRSREDSNLKFRNNRVNMLGYPGARFRPHKGCDTQAATLATERASRSRDNGVARTSAPLRTVCVVSLSNFGSLIDLSRFLRCYRELQCYNPAFRLTTCQLP